MKRTFEKIMTVFITLFLIFFALVSIHDLEDPDLCVRAAFIITGAYSWLGLVLWANLIHGRFRT